MSMPGAASGDAGAASLPEQDPRSVIRADIRALHAYPVAAAEGMVKLDLMENPYGLPPELAAGLGQHLAGVALNRYPSGDPQELKQRLAAWSGAPAGSALLLGNGSDELIHLLIQACAGPDACVLSPWPSFSMYRISAGLDRCGFVGVDLRPDLAFDLPALLEAMQRHRPALVFLSYPNNPTGLLASRADISAILAAAPGLVVVDEAYLPFAQSTWIGELPHHPRLLVLRTLSKLGLAGLRLGMLFGAPAVLAEVDKLRPPFNVNSLTQAAVSYLLDHTPVLDAQAAQVRADRAELARELARLPGVTALPSTANFLLVRVPGAPRVWAGLHQRGILVKDVSGSHPLLADCLRITVGTPEENRRLLGALQACL